MIVRAERQEDRAAVRALLEAVFAGPSEADLVDALRGTPAWLPGLSLVAEHDGAVVGYLLFTRAHVAATPILALAPLAVAKERQRGGIGQALVRAGLETVRARGERAVVLVGHPAYYRRFGFEPAVPRGLTSGFAEGARAPALQVIALQEHALEDLRGAVAYAPAFDALA